MRIIVVGILVASLALTILWSNAWASPAFAKPLALVPDTRPAVCTLVLEGVRDGKIAGYVRGDVRFFIGDELVVPNASGAFLVPASVLRTDVRTVDIPAGALFVASKKGKRFYPVGSFPAQGLTPANRIYFFSEEQARAAGFR